MSTSPSPDAAPVRVYRTLPAKVIGWGMIAVALVLTGLTVRDLLAGHTADVVSPLALITGVATAGWVLFLRPRAALYPDRVELANVLSDSTVPFAAIEDVTFQWALELHDAQGRRHSAWAVPVRREMTRRRSIDDFAETTRRRGSEGTTAQGAADEVLRALSSWRLAGGEADPMAEVTRRVAPSAVAALGLTLLLALASVLV